MKKLALLFFLLVSYSISAAVKVSVPKELLEGENGQIKLEASAGEQIRMGKVSQKNGLQLGSTSTSSSTNIINGKRTSSSTLTTAFQITTNSSSFLFPGFSYTVNGQKKTMAPQQIKIIKKKSIAKKLYTKVYYNGSPNPPKQVYVGQQVELKLHVYVLKSIHGEPRLPILKIPDVRFQDYSKINRQYTNVNYSGNGEQIIDGNRFLIFQFISNFTPMNSIKPINGHLDLTWSVISKSGQTRRDMFGRRVRNTENRPLGFNLPKISVKALPVLKTDPANFLGLIGNFNLNAKLNKSTVKAGDAVNLTLTVTGVGLNAINPPELSIKGFRSYKPNLTVAPDQTSAKIDWVLVPLSEKEKWPELKFSFFSAHQQKYVTKAFSLPLTILPGDPALAASVLKMPVNKGDINLKNEAVDILFVKSKMTAPLKLPLYLNALLTLILTVLFSFITILITWFLYSKQNIDNCTHLTRQYMAKKNRGKVMKNLNKGQTPTEIQACLSHEVIPWLIDLYALPKGSSVSELSTVIKNPKLIAMLEDADQSSYRPSSGNEFDLKVLVKRLKKLSVIAILFFGSQFSFATSFQDGIKAYESAQYEKATAIFSTLHQESPGVAAISYNLGNCAYSQQNYAQAMAWYEQANRLAPSDTDIIQNLNFVRHKIGYEAIFSEKGPLQLLINVRDHLRPDQWLSFSLILMAALVLLFCVEKIKMKKWNMLKFTFLALMLLSLFAWQSQYVTRYKNQFHAAVISDSQLYRLPSTDVADSTGVKAGYGRIVTILEVRPSYCLIKLDKAVGWIKKDHLQFFWNEERK